MEKVQMKYVGKQDTLVRTERNGEKVEVKEGDVVEIDRALAERYAKSYKVWVPVDGPVAKAAKTEPKEEPKTEKVGEPAKVEGGLDEEKIEKTVPKKGGKKS